MEFIDVSKIPADYELAGPVDQNAVIDEAHGTAELRLTIGLRKKPERRRLTFVLIEADRPNKITASGAMSWPAHLEVWDNESGRMFSYSGEIEGELPERTDKFLASLQARLTP